MAIADMAYMALLRWFVGLALLANLGYAAWTWGWLSPLGLAPASQRDPGRLQRQLRPDALRVLSPAAAAAAAASAAAVGPVQPMPAPATTPAPSPGVPDAAASANAGAAAVSGSALACLEVGPLDNDAAIDSAERALAVALPARPWSRDARPGPPQYAVFVGPVLSRESAIARREELTRLRISFEAVELPGGQQGGYSLGLHTNPAAAQAALEGFRERGLRNGSVALVRDGGPRTWLRMDRLAPAQADAVRALSAVQLGGVVASGCDLGSVMSVGAPR